MNQEKTGRLLAQLRRESGATQSQVATAVGVSVQAVSKWERGLGCPDISLLPALAEYYSVSAASLLAGELKPGNAAGGSLKRLEFHLCPECGNMITAMGSAQVSCCGRVLAPLEQKPMDAAHHPTISVVEDEWYLTWEHGMEKEHALSFVSLVGFDRIYTVKLYPEQDAAARLPMLRRAKLVVGCAAEGVFVEAL